MITIKKVFVEILLMEMKKKSKEQKLQRNALKIQLMTEEKNKYFSIGKKL